MDKDEQIHEKCIVHPSVYVYINILRSWKKKRQYLKSFGLTKSQQSKVIREAKEYENL